jgi:hypothetical protein
MNYFFAFLELGGGGVSNITFATSSNSAGCRLIGFSRS